MNPFDAEMNKISVQIVGLCSADKQNLLTIIYNILKLEKFKIYYYKAWCFYYSIGSRCRVCLFFFCFLGYQECVALRYNTKVLLKGSLWWKSSDSSSVYI